MATVDCRVRGPWAREGPGDSGDPTTGEVCLSDRDGHFSLLTSHFSLLTSHFSPWIKVYLAARSGQTNNVITKIDEF